MELAKDARIAKSTSVDFDIGRENYDYISIEEKNGEKYLCLFCSWEGYKLAVKLKDVKELIARARAG
jgi:hypothetical protein